MEAPLLQIRGDHVEVSDDAEEIAAACRVFRDGGFLRFPALLDDASLRAWNERARGEDAPTEGRGRLAAMLSEPRVLALVGRIVGDAPAGFRADRAPPLGDEGWHDGPSRACVAALALHVGTEPCRGSTLEMRPRGGADVVSIPTTTPGDAVLFRFDGAVAYRMCAGTDAPGGTFTGRFVRDEGR